jgi:serine protease Do
VKKIVNDLIQYGDVKRGFIGISYPSQDSENERKVKLAGLADGQGVYVEQVPTEGAAAQAGLKKGDIITKVNGNPVATGLEMSAQIASFKPGDKVPLVYLRSNKEYTVAITLKESAGKLDLASTFNLNEVLGADLENLDKKKALTYEIEGGVIVKKIKADGAFSKTRMQDGFIITNVNGVDITSIEDLSKAILSLRGESIQLEGMYPGYEGVYRYPLNLE